MSYDTHCSSCGMPYSDFAREGAKSCECHKMAAQAVRDFVFDKPALSAAPVAQEPVARLCGYCKTWNSKPCGEQCYLQPSDPVWTSPPATQQASADFLHEEMIKLGSPLTYTACLTLTKRITDTNTLAWAGEVNKLCTEIGSLKNEIAALKSAANPPATPAGLGAEEIARALYEMQPVEDRSDENGDPIPWDGLADFCQEVHFEEAKRFTSALLSRGSGIRATPLTKNNRHRTFDSRTAWEI